MEHKYTASLTLGGLLCLAVVVAISAYHVAGLDNNISKLIKASGESRTMEQTLEQDVKNQAGETITVKTTRGPSETVEAFAARHQEAVVAAKALG